jgi:hypothetical protein
MPKSTRLAGLAAVAALGLVSTAPFAYSPGVQRYRVTITTHNARDQGGGRAPMEYEYTTSQFVSLALAPKSQDALTMTMTVDSITQSTDMNAPPRDYSWAKGVKLTGIVASNGKIVSFAPPKTADANIELLYQGFRHFLPIVPVAFAPGAAWADTVRDHVQHRGSFDSVSTDEVINSKVTGDTTYAGQHVWRVERTGNVSLTGDGAEGGKPLHLDGDGSIKGALFLTPTGVFLGAKSTQTIRLVESFQDTGEGAPITQTISSLIEPLAPVRTASVSGIR